MPITYFDIAPHVAAGLTDPAAIQAAIIADPPARWFRLLTSTEALDWLGQGGRLAKMQAAAGDEATPINLRAAMQATLIVVNRSDLALDLSPGSAHRTLLLGCAAAGIFESDDVNSLIDSCRLVADPTVEEIAACILNHELEARYTAALSAGRAAINDGAPDWETVRAAIVAGGDGWGI